MDLRCAHRKHAVLEDGLLEVKCSDRFCKEGQEYVVLHYFDVHTGELINTRRFRDPARRRQE